VLAADADADADAASAQGDAQIAADAQVPVRGPPRRSSWCWGVLTVVSLDHGDQRPDLLGDNRRGQASVPGALSASFVPRGGDVTCAIEDGRVRCWGDSTHGQLTVPPSSARVTQVAVGDGHACALAEGSVRCWGDDSSGQLRVPELRGRARDRRGCTAQLRPGGRRREVLGRQRAGPMRRFPR
jgi:hypothetical protein